MCLALSDCYVSVKSTKELKRKYLKIFMADLTKSGNPCDGVSVIKRLNVTEIVAMYDFMPT